MKIIIILLFVLNFCFGQDQNIDQRLNNIEESLTKMEAQILDITKDIQTIVSYLNSCHLELYYAGQGSFGRCPMGSVMGEWSEMGNPPYTTIWTTCYKYQLVCR